MSMIKGKITFKTLSPVILSSRMEGALYQGVDFKEVEKNTKIQIVYSFYSYCNRNLKAERPFEFASNYYIPASALKGALLGRAQSCDFPKEVIGEQEEKLFRSQMRFRDIEIKPTEIILENIHKIQYLYQNESTEKQENIDSTKVYKIPKLDVFFPSIQVEMLQAGTEFCGEILLKVEENTFKEKLKNNYKNTTQKIENYINEIDGRYQKIKKWKLSEKKLYDTLSNIKKSLQGYLDGEHKLIFLGGYKGLLASLNQLDTNNEKEIRNGFYIDPISHLPYGLVEVIKEEYFKNKISIKNI